MTRPMTYGDLLAWMRVADPRVHSWMMLVWIPGASRLALPGLAVLAISCAIRGEEPDVAAAHCRCTVADLDEATTAFITVFTRVMRPLRDPARLKVVARNGHPA